MSKKAKEILEMHMGADYWKLEKTDYFKNLINAVNEALSMPPVMASKQRLKCENCSREIETYKDYCANCQVANALLY